MNPVLIKPSGDRKSQVLVMGKPYADATARSYQELKHELKAPVIEALNDLRARFDVVVCEGAGSPAEINLRAGRPREHGPRARREPAGARDRRHRPRRRLPLPLRHARAARARGPGAHRRLPDQQVPRRPEHPATPAWTCSKASPAARRTASCPGSTARSSTPRTRSRSASTRRDGGTLDVVVIRLRWMSNFTDVDALAAEPGVSRPVHAARPRTSSAPTSSSCPARRRPSRTSSASRTTASTKRSKRARARSSASAAATRCSATASRTASSPTTAPTGLGLLDLNTTLRAREAAAPGHRHRLRRPGDRLRDPPRPRRPRRAADPGRRRARHRLARPARRRRRPPQDPHLGSAERRAATGLPAPRAFADVREAHLDRLADWFGAHVDAAALTDLIEQGAPEGLPTIPPGGAACSVF